MRREVIELGKLGPLPPSEVAIRENLQEVVNRYSDLMDSIEKPLTDEEAKVLVKLFGPDDCFGLVWPLIHLIETAPNWPLEDCLEDTSNEWVELLEIRVKNASKEWLEQRAARGRNQR